MYSLLMFLGIWIWFFLHQFLEAGSDKFWSSVGLLLTSVVFLYSHGASFLLLASLNCYVLVWFLQARNRRVFWKWVLLQGLILMLYVPWLIHARSVVRAHLLTPSLTNVVRTIGAMMWGFGWSGISLAAKDWVAWPLFLLVVAALLTAITTKSGERNVAISFVVAPAAFCLAVSHLIRPIWMYRTLAYTMPFLCVVLVPGEKAVTRNAFSWKELAAWGVMILALVAFVSGLVFQKAYLHPSLDYRSASEFVRQEARRGEVIYVVYDRTFWSWCWYFVGPGHISPLNDNRPAVNAQGISVVPAYAWETRPLPGSIYWLIHQENESIAPFDSMPHQVELAQEFRNLWVKRVRSTASD
jgi:hypothetical protein